MSVCMSVSLDNTIDTSAEYLTCKDGRRFIAVRLAPTLTVFLPGFDIEAAGNAKQIAMTLLDVAERLERAFVDYPDVLDEAGS